MRAKYNTFTFPDGRWSISKSITSNENEAHQELSTIHRVDIDGRLQADSAALIEAQYTLLTRAYSVNGEDFLVFLPTGGISERLSLRSAGSLGGVRVIQKPSIEGLENGQYTTYLPVKISLEAEYPSTNSDILLTSFRETVNFEGGGPVHGWYRPIRGLPTKGIVRQLDTYRATQSGSAVGYLDYPRLGTIAGAPPPIWGFQHLNANPRVSRDSAELHNGSYINWPITWSYEFESATPLFGSPNLWPT